MIRSTIIQGIAGLLLIVAVSADMVPSSFLPGGQEILNEVDPRITSEAFQNKDEVCKILCDAFLKADVKVIPGGVFYEPTTSRVFVIGETIADVVKLRQLFRRAEDRRKDLSHSERPKSQQTTSTAEPAGPAQPATKAADKEPPNDQPSTPTSKDAPR